MKYNWQRMPALGLEMRKLTKMPIKNHSFSILSSIYTFFSLTGLDQEKGAEPIDFANSSR